MYTPRELCTCRGTLFQGRWKHKLSLTWMASCLVMCSFSSESLILSMIHLYWRLIFFVTSTIKNLSWSLEYLPVKQHLSGFLAVVLIFSQGVLSVASTFFKASFLATFFKAGFLDFSFFKEACLASRHPWHLSNHHALLQKLVAESCLSFSSTTLVGLPLRVQRDITHSGDLPFGTMAFSTASFFKGLSTFFKVLSFFFKISFFTFFKDVFFFSALTFFKVSLLPAFWPSSFFKAFPWGTFFKVSLLLPAFWPSSFFKAFLGAHLSTPPFSRSCWAL